MIEYKMDVVAALREAGYTTYRIRREALLPSSAVKALATGGAVSFETLDALCGLLGCDVGDIIHHVKNTRAPGGEPRTEDGGGIRDLAEKYR